MAGRPKIEINLKELELLSQVGATNGEIALLLGVSERTIDDRRKDPDFREVMDRGVAAGNLSLRRKQMSMALAGDRALLIWLGKQRLGQRDKISAEVDVSLAHIAQRLVNARKRIVRK